MVDSLKHVQEVGPNMLSAINIIVTGIVAIVTALLGYFGGRVHEMQIVSKKAK